MKAIIVAAGRGRRLGQETDVIPKCMVRVAGKPILHHQLAALAAAGVDEVVIVRGYRGDRIAPPDGGPPVRFVENPAWADNNILTSLFYAENEMSSGFVFSYSDIVFAPDHARRVVASPGPIALIVDRRWRDAYQGRTEHPVSEAELARVAESAAGPIVARVGKRLVAEAEATGEFSGLARFTAEGAAALAAVWRDALARGRTAPFGAAATLNNAYLSDGLNAVAERGVALRPVLVDGGWREIDTEQDLARAELSVAAWT